MNKRINWKIFLFDMRKFSFAALVRHRMRRIAPHSKSKCANNWKSEKKTNKHKTWFLYIIFKVMFADDVVCSAAPATVYIAHVSTIEHINTLEFNYSFEHSCCWCPSHYYYYFIISNETTCVFYLAHCLFFFRSESLQSKERRTL